MVSKLKFKVGDLIQCYHPDRCQCRMTGTVTGIDFGVGEYIIIVTNPGISGGNEVGDERFISFQGAVGLSKLEKILK